MGLHKCQTKGENEYQALGKDLGVENEWFSIKLLTVLKKVTNPSEAMVTAANKLMESENPMVKKAVIDFIGSSK